MGTLYIVATPIGNLEDITLRAIKILSLVDYIACEDTRRTGQLLRHLKIEKKNLISYYDEVEEVKTPEIVNLIEEGHDVALVSDAGTPLISDPGYKLVRECIRRDIKVVSIPGPSSVIEALIVSGLPINKFTFMGYIPAKKNRRREFLKEIKGTVVFFETANRLKESLEDIKNIFGDIEIVIARELTKIHEEVWRGKISEAIKREFRGEIVLCLQV